MDLRLLLLLLVRQGRLHSARAGRQSQAAAQQEAAEKVNRASVYVGMQIHTHTNTHTHIPYRTVGNVRPTLMTDAAVFDVVSVVVVTCLLGRSVMFKCNVFVGPYGSLHLVPRSACTVLESQMGYICALNTLIGDVRRSPPGIFVLTSGLSHTLPVLIYC